MLPTSKLINEIYEELQVDMIAYNVASEHLAIIKHKVNTARYDAIHGYVLEGKNAEAREADFRAKFPHLIQELHDIEMEHKQAKLQLDLGKLEVDRIKLLIRLQEIEK